MKLYNGKIITYTFDIDGMYESGVYIITITGLSDSYFDVSFSDALTEAISDYPGISYSNNVLTISSGAKSGWVSFSRTITSDVPDDAIHAVSITPTSGSSINSASCISNKSAIDIGKVRGAAISGLEFSTELLPLQGDFTWLAAKGFTHVRIPYLWNRVQPTLGSALTTSVTSFANLVQCVTWARASGLKIILDMHNYGKRPIAATGTSYYFGTDSIPEYYLVDFYDKLSAYFGDVPDIFYELQNEPDRLLTSEFMYKLMNGCIGVIRKNGCRTTVIANTLGPNAYLFKRYTNKQALENFGKLKDPLDNVVYCAHQYLDSGYGGSAATCVVGANVAVDDFIKYASDNGLKVIFTEFAFGDPTVASNAQCGIEGPALLEKMNAEPSVGWLAWGCGSRWTTSYAFRMIPVAGNDPTNADTGYVTTLIRYI